MDKPESGIPFLAYANGRRLSSFSNLGTSCSSPHTERSWRAVTPQPWGEKSWRFFWGTPSYFVPPSARVGPPVHTLYEHKQKHPGCNGF